MRIEALDHVALWVADRDRLADFLTRHLALHVIERTDAFTLVGADARLGKLTLFAAEGERQPGALARVAFRVRDLERALADLPPGVDLATENGEAFFTAPEGVSVGLVATDEGAEYDIEHVAFRAPDPDAAFSQLVEYGLVPAEGRLRAGQAFVEFERGHFEAAGRPLLNHLGLRVESAEEHIEEARRRGFEIADIVDAPNTYAVFLQGPAGIKLEYVEHKATFSLA